MRSHMEKYKVGGIPEGKSGEWRVERHKVTEDEARASALNSRGRWVPPGRYTGLIRGRGDHNSFGATLVMSDTPDEIRDHLTAMRRSKDGCALVHGLGLGVVANGMLLNGCKHVTVIELSPHVIELVAPHWRSVWGERIEVIQADAMTWTAQRGASWDVVWHDIWDHICADNLEQMKTLHRRYGRRCGWQGSWARGLCERYA